MRHLICYNVNNRIDGYIALKFGYKPEYGKRGMHPAVIASLRGLYDQDAEESGRPPLLDPDKTDFTDEELDAAYKELANFRRAIQNVQRAKLANNVKNISKAYDTLRHVYTAEQRKYRIGLITALFSEEVDRIMQQADMPREAVINGFDTVGGYVGGPHAIFDSVYNAIANKRQMYYTRTVYPEIGFKQDKAQGLLDYQEAPTDVESYRQVMQSRYEQYTLILENWDALLPFVCKQLNRTGGLKIGIKQGYAMVSTDMFGDNDINALWEISESKREGWQENSDLQSSFGSIGQQVRRLLSTVPEMQATWVYEEEDDGLGGTRKVRKLKYVHKTDDLGNKVFMDPVKTHQFLMDYLSGMTDVNNMMDKLANKVWYETLPDGTRQPVYGADGKRKQWQAKVPWMQGLVDLLASNPRLRTQFFVDFDRIFQPYSKSYEDKNTVGDFIKKIKTTIINRANNYVQKRYEVSISSKGKYPESLKVNRFKPMFQEGRRGGQVDWERFMELRTLTRRWVTAKTGVERWDEKLHEYRNTSTAGVFNKIKAYGTCPLIDRSNNNTITLNGKKIPVTYEMKRDFLLEVFSSLGIDIMPDTVDLILQSPDIYAVRRYLDDLFSITDDSHGMKYVLNSEADFSALIRPNVSAEAKAEAAERLNKAGFTWPKIYNRDKNNGHPVKDTMRGLFEIIQKHQEGNRIESRARYKNKTYFSHVQPNFLGDTLKTIKAYVDNEDKEGLKQFLTIRYLQSPYFVDDDYLFSEGKSGHILNPWLQALVDACDDKTMPLRESAAAIFSFERNLGNDDKEFENFTLKEHGEDMLIHFFADEQQKKSYGGVSKSDVRRKLSASYPVFVLGDAGVSKYIRAPRFTTASSRNGIGEVEYNFDKVAKMEMLEKYYGVFLQEQRRMALDEAFQAEHPLYANGKRVQHPKGEFSILTFMNPTPTEYKKEYNPYNPNGSLKSKREIMRIIEKYLDEATGNFKKKLEDKGVLETAVVGGKPVFKSLSDIADPSNIDSKIEEFFWNTKLATIAQLQMMTIDPAFYASTKDLQKRYKEIHAPGSKLDIYALDYDNNRYSDGIERVVYFDDISLNAETFNPEFMRAILKTFRAKGVTDEQIEEAIADNILQPRESKEDETERQNKLQDLLGENYKTYATYTKNTLTDGQGYRTLSSYRKVMGMAGKWTAEMETAYKKTMELRDKLAIKDSEGNIVDIAEMSDSDMRELNMYIIGITWQPIKPYMFTHEQTVVPYQLTKNGVPQYDDNGDPIWMDVTYPIPVQHKYAEALIIPELLPKGHKLRDMGFWMDSHNVDMVGSTKICKVGCYGQADFSKVKSKEDLHSALNQESVVIHQLSYADYMIQTNVPEHINASQLFGTQLRKLIMAGIHLDNLYDTYIGGSKVNLSILDKEDDANRQATLTGRNLLALYNSLHTANILDSYDTFAENAEDIQLMSELLQQSTVGSMREAMDNLLSYVVTGSEEELKQFLIPIFEGGLEHDSAALILSTFRKIVNKQQISGGSAVQVSAFGIQGYEEDGDLRYVTDPDNDANVLYTEVEMPFDISIIISTETKGGTVKKQAPLSYGKYCFNNGYLKPTQKALEKGTAEWKKYQSYTYKRVNDELVPCKYDDPKAEVHKPLIEVDYPDCLSFIAYRIPTERAYSMMNCQIKRFTKKTAGGTIKVPAQGTSVAGFDFDIDKLYFMRREYRVHQNDKYYTESNFSQPQVNILWNLFYKQNKEIEETLLVARNEAELGNPDLVADKNARPKLHTYWEAAKIQEKFGLSKQEAFMLTAKRVGLKPTQNIPEGVQMEWMETYDFAKAPEDNTRTARNNMLITLIQARLSDPETMKSRYTPGGFDEASRAARFMRELMHGDLGGVTRSKGSEYIDIDMEKIQARYDEKDAVDPEPDYNPSDPYTILYYNEQNQVAGKLIGIFANQNTNHAFCSAMEKFELKEPISFCGHSFKDLLHKNPEDAARVDLNMANFLGAAVDAVKDPTLNYLNFNTMTADVGALLARLGYNLQEIGLLLNQPIIRKACEAALNRGVQLDTTLSEIVQNLRKSTTGLGSNHTELTAKALALNIANERRHTESGKKQEDFFAAHAQMQLAIIETVQKVLKPAQDVSAFVTNTKFTASNSVKSTMGGMYAQQMKVAEYLNRFRSTDDKHGLSYVAVVSRDLENSNLFSTPISDSEKLVDLLSTKGKTNKQIREDRKEYIRQIRYNPFAYEQAMFDANRAAVRLLSKYYPYETKLYKEARAKIQSLADFGTLSEEEINAVHADLLVALMSNQEASLFNGEAPHKVGSKRDGYTNREYYRYHFASDLADFIAENPEALDLPIFKYLTPSVETVDVLDKYGSKKGEEEHWTVSIQDVGGMDTELKDDIRESWASLMVKDADGEYVNPDAAEIGRDLFMYCFYQLGFDFSPLSFMHLTPTEVKDNILIERPDDKLAPLMPFEEIKNPEEGATDDVLVWIQGTEESGTIRDYAGVGADVFQLAGNSYKLPSELQHRDIERLIQAAQSNPELTFKIATTLTQEQFDLFTSDSTISGIPTNIKFSKETLDNVSEESKAKVQYGKYRTYREFLGQVLKGELGLNTNEFAQMFLMNHLEFSKFTLDVNRTHRSIRNFIYKAAGISATTTEMPATIKLDAATIKDSSKEDNIYSRLVKTEEGHSKWKPILKINNTYYIAQGMEGTFNVAEGTAMTYVKVEPLGTAKTIRYGSGKQAKKLAPAKKYSTSFVEATTAHSYESELEPVQSSSEQQVSGAPSVTQQQGQQTQQVAGQQQVQETQPVQASAEVQTDNDIRPEEPVTSSNPQTSKFGELRTHMEEYVVKEFTAGYTRRDGGIQDATIQLMQKVAHMSSDEELLQTMDQLRKACRENGVIVLDDKGEITTGC